MLKVSEVDIGDTKVSDAQHRALVFFRLDPSMPLVPCSILLLPDSALIWRMSRVTRDGTAKPVPRDEILRREREQGYQAGLAAIHG